MDNSNNLPTMIDVKIDKQGATAVEKHLVGFSILGLAGTVSVLFYFMIAGNNELRRSIQDNSKATQDILINVVMKSNSIIQDNTNRLNDNSALLMQVREDLKQKK